MGKTRYQSTGWMPGIVPFTRSSLSPSRHARLTVFPLPATDSRVDPTAVRRDHGVGARSCRSQTTTIVTMVIGSTKPSVDAEKVPSASCFCAARIR